MFAKILIANRGEIACRIIRTCHNLGIKTVAIYSQFDRDALHVRLANEAYLVGEAPPRESYLNMDRILSVARETSAEAVHPGYGFLSENPAFARRCQEEDIRFIGPSPELMERMGDKLRARRLAREAGLPVLPGTDEAVDDREAEERASQLGFPLMVKAAEGGGGIGIHVIESMDELIPVIERTRQVAASAFGSPRLYFERYVRNGSHIEVQLIGDDHGHLVHLYERDCSIQRRNQKLIEETPATKLTPKLRQRLCNMALKLGNRIGYTNAGTVEFLVSVDGQVHFLEMNTRLQVEHGVTEMVTGVDVVDLQIRVAAGEPLPLEQKDIKVTGHAIEARIYPEDPETLVPQAGKITGLHEPSGAHIRVDSALCAGYEVGLHYEPLLAKVMAWGATRQESVKRLQRALLALRLEGVVCNVPMLREVLSSEEFVEATHHTGSVPQGLATQQSRKHRLSENGPMPNGEQERADREIAAATAAAVALALKHSQPDGSPDSTTSPWRTYGRREQLLSRTLRGRSRGWR